MQVEMVGPERARELLAMNTKNRKVRTRHVRKLAHDMAAGNWRFTGEPIILNGTTLLDGQHRLMAVVESGTTVQMLVVDNVDSDAMPFIDRGVPRLLSDALAWDGIPNAAMVGTVSKRLLTLSEGNRLSDGQRLALYTDSDVKLFVQKHGDTVQWAGRIGQRISKAVGGKRTEWAVAVGWLALNGAELDVVELFATEVATGANLGEGAPALTLRNWAVQCGVKRRRLRSDELLIATVKAFNNWVTGRPMKMVKVMPSETLPKVEAM